MTYTLKLDLDDEEMAVLETSLREASFALAVGAVARRVLDKIGSCQVAADIARDLAGEEPTVAMAGVRTRDVLRIDGERHRVVEFDDDGGPVVTMRARPLTGAAAPLKVFTFGRSKRLTLVERCGH